ncbi:protein peste-like isoform X2 [Atheta coriaria]
MKRTRIIGRYCRGFVFTLGTVFTFIGLLFLLQFNGMYDLIVMNALKVEDGSKAYEAWRTNDPPLILDMYMFNWTNAHEVYNESVKPHFEQVGPYRFLEVKEKYDIVFHENDTVSYKYLKRYYFMDEESPCQLTDVINTLNTVATSAAYKTRFDEGFKKWSMDFTMSMSSSVYVTKTIDELLFKGYYDPLLGVLKQVSPFLPDDAQIEDHNFGWFYKRNNTRNLSGEFSMSTKQDHTFGRMVSWNHRNETDFFEGECNKIRGSAGEFYPLDRTRDSITLYSNELCTFAEFDYEKDEFIKDVRGYKYSAQTLFENGTIYPKNQCYCQGECLPSGVLNISSCRQGAPIFLSLPHFYNADPYYTNLIDGLTPNKKDHDFYITLEPKSAIAIEVGVRMQLNLLLQPIKGYSLFSNVPKIMVPIFFFDQVVTMSDELATSVYLIQNLPEIVEHVSYVFVVLGVSMMILVLITNCIWPSSKNRERNEYKVAAAQAVEVPLTTKEVHIHA